MELKAKIYQIGQTQKVSESFSKREFIVETDEQYKQHILLQVVKDKCDVLNNYKVGDHVTVSLNIKGRLWTNPQNEEKCFNTLECWRITKTEQVNNSAIQNYETSPNLPKEEEHDNLPF